MEHRVTITYDGGPDEDQVDRLLDALVHHARGMGPVVSTGPSTYSIVLALEAPDVQGALANASATAALAIAAAELTAARARSAEVELIDARAPAIAA